MLTLPSENVIIVNSSPKIKRRKVLHLIIISFVSYFFIPMQPSIFKIVFPIRFAHGILDIPSRGTSKTLEIYDYYCIPKYRRVGSQAHRRWLPTWRSEWR